MVTTRKSVRSFPRAALSFTVAALLWGTPARADIVFYDVFKDQSFLQTANNAAPTTPVGFQGTVNVEATSAGDLSGGTVTVPGSPLSPITLTGSGTFYAAGAGYATKAHMDADFPNNATYTFNISGGTFGGQSGTLSTPASDAYSATVPYFTGNTFNALQGLNAASAINLTFNPYDAVGGFNTPLTFIGITRVSDGQFVYGTSGPNTLAAALVDANTLAAGTQYDLSIVYSNRATTQGDFPNSTAFAAYDLRTDLIFTTAAVPEPSTFVLAGIGFATLVTAKAARRRRLLKA